MPFSVLVTIFVTWIRYQDVNAWCTAFRGWWYCTRLHWPLQYYLFWLAVHDTSFPRVNKAVKRERTEMASQSNYRILKRSEQCSTEGKNYGIYGALKFLWQWLEQEWESKPIYVFQSRGPNKIIFPGYTSFTHPWLIHGKISTYANFCLKNNSICPNVQSLRMLTVRFQSSKWALMLIF